jgi:hypothetical protein
MTKHSMSEPRNCVPTHAPRLGRPALTLPSWDDAPEPVRNIYRRIARSEIMEERQEFAEECEHP